MRKLHMGKSTGIPKIRKKLLVSLKAIHKFNKSDGSVAFTRQFSMTAVFVRARLKAERLNTTAVLKRCGLILKNDEINFNQVTWFVRPLSALDDLSDEILSGVMSEVVVQQDATKRFRKLTQVKPGVEKQTGEALPKFSLTTIYDYGTKVLSQDWFDQIEERFVRIATERDAAILKRDEALSEIAKLTQQLETDSPSEMFLKEIRSYASGGSTQKKSVH